jgi:acyl carrier protein
MQDGDLVARVAEVICEALELELLASDLRPENSLVELGLDSLKAVGLAVALEKALGIPEFPIQEWADAEAEHPAPRYTIASLSATCAALLDARGPARGSA